MTNTEAAAYNAAGFEIGLHLNTGCADYSREELEGYFDEQMADVQVALSRACRPQPPTGPTASPGAATRPWRKWKLEHGIRMDANYYYWPGDWVADRPGFFTGSGMPMRFASSTGDIIDVYQAATQMTDESGQTFPYTIDTLLDKAIGPEGYYGAFTANIHTDEVDSPYSDAIIDSALNRGVPVISARQLLKWADGRNGSYFGAFSSTATTLSFSVTVGQGANGLEVMVPKPSGKSISGIQRNGGSVGYTSKVVKGQDYAVFFAIAGNYVVTFTGDTQPPTVFSTLPVAGAANVATGTTVRVAFSEAMDPATISGTTFQLRGPGSTVVSAAVTYESGTNTAVLTPSTALAAGTSFTATVLGGSGGVKDAAGNPLASDYVWSFTTAAAGAVQTYSIWGTSAVPCVPGRHGHQRSGTGYEVPKLACRVCHGAPFLQGLRQHRDPCGQPVEFLGHESGHGEFHRRDVLRLAVPGVCRPGGYQREHHLRDIVLRSRGPLFGRLRVFCDGGGQLRRCGRSPTAKAAATGSTATAPPASRTRPGTPPTTG